MSIFRIDYRIEHYPEVRVILQRFGVTADQVRGKAKLANVIAARKEVVLHFRSVGASFHEIGQKLGRHSTTIMDIAGAHRGVLVKGLGVE